METGWGQAAMLAGAGADAWCLAGGSESSQRVPGHISSFDIPDLEGGVSYTVKVTALVGNREGNPVSIIVTTRELRGTGTALRRGALTPALTPAPLPAAEAAPVSPVSGFQVMEASEQRLRLAWVPVAGSTGYRLAWRLAEGECGIVPVLHGHAVPQPLTSLSPHRRAPAQPAAPGHLQLL